MLNGPMGVVIVLGVMSFAGLLTACGLAYFFPAQWDGERH